MNCLMEKAILITATFILTGCSHGNSGFYSRETKDTYRMQVGGAVEDPDYTFQRGAYEICKLNNESGIEILKKDWKTGEMNTSWIEAWFKCTGIPDDYLKSKFNDLKDQYIEMPSPIAGFEKKFILK